MTPEQLTEIIAAFPNDSKRHHHALIRGLARELLATQLERLLLRAQVDGLNSDVRKLQRNLRDATRQIELDPCEKVA